MRFGKDAREQYDIAVPKNEARQSKDKAAPVRGLLVMLGSCVAFLAFLALLTVVVHFIML